MTEILECGTGVTTVVMACALRANEREGHPRGRITSMEDQQEYYDQAAALLPEGLSSYVDLVLSDKVEYCYAIFRGVGYKNIPERPYQFVFVDGPGTMAPSDGTRSFDFDFINVVRKSTKGVFGIVDKRLGTLYCLQKVFGVELVRYDPRLDLGFVGPCSQGDIRSRISGDSFSHSVRLIRNSELDLQMGL